MTLPKVLVVGQPFTRHTGGGITLSNLFSGWDRDKLGVVCVDNLFDGNIETDICDRYYRLGQLEHQWVFPFSLVKSKHESGPVTFSPKQGGPVIATGKSSFRVKLVMDYFIPLMQWLGLFHLMSSIKMSDQLRAWLDEFQPDVIYAQAPTREMVLFCIAVKDYLKKPMVYHVMDDWPSTIGSGGPFGSYWKKVVDGDLRALLSRTDVFMSISEYMSKEYKRRYGRDSVAFHNPINIDFWKAEQRTTHELPENPTILYAGRTGMGIDTSLRTIAKAVQQVNREQRVSLKFVLQTGEKPGWINRYSCVEHRTFVPYGELPRVFAEADFLILPYDFSRSALKFIKYSMPTKASEFMISGTPIIIFAPKRTAMVNYAEKYQWAKVVTENSLHELAATIRRLVQNRAARQSMAQKAIEIAESRHDARAITRDFRKVICSLHPTGLPTTH